MAYKHPTMRFLFGVVLLNTFMVKTAYAANGIQKGKLKKAGEVGGKNEVLLNGFTAESRHLPLQLVCDASDKGILLGSITIDSKQVNNKLLESAKNECQRTQQMLSTGPLKERLRCSLELADAKYLTGEEYFRVVYQCYKDAPSGWGEEEIKTVSQKKAGKYATMECTKKAIFKILSVKVNGVKVDTSKFPELESGAIVIECFMQSFKGMTSNGKKTYECSIKNKIEYGGTLEISYRCDNPPTYNEAHIH